jgi:6-phosphogluconate dehydrogenase (decarboxylating)
MSSSLPHFPTVSDRDGAAVLDVSRNQITTLNSTGGFIWEKLQDGRTVAEAIQDLANECNTDSVIVEAGVHNFLEQLRSERLFTR